MPAWTALPALAKQNTERDLIWEVKTYQNSIYKHSQWFSLINNCVQGAFIQKGFPAKVPPDSQ